MVVVSQGAGQSPRRRNNILERMEYDLQQAQREMERARAGLRWADCDLCDDDMLTMCVDGLHEGYVYKRFDDIM